MTTEPTVTLGPIETSEEAERCWWDTMGEQLAAEIRRYWGPRCDDFDPDCVLCRKWAAFDELFGEIP